MRHLSCRPLKCRAVRKRLPLFVGGDLDAGEQTAVEVHLGQCLDCFRQSKAERASLMLLHGAAEATALNPMGLPRAEQFVAEVMGQIHGPPPTRRSWITKTVAVSGWAAALVLGSLLWLHNTSSSGSGVSVQSLPSTRSDPTTTTNTGFPNSERGLALDAPAGGLLDDSGSGEAGPVLNLKGVAPIELNNVEMSERYLAVRDF